MPDDPDPFIAICLPVADMLHPHTALSILNASIKRPAATILARGKIVDQARNDLVRDALALEYEGRKVTHILWIDDDMIFREDAVARLLAHDLPIVGGLCYNRHHPYNSVILRKPPSGCEGVGYLYVYEADFPNPPGLIACDATGAAFLLVKREVFEAILPTLRPGHGPFSQLGLGEDVSFCERARGLGFRIFVDTSIEIGHVGEVVVTRDFAMKNRSSPNDLFNAWTPTIDVTKCGLRILGNEETPDGRMHRGRYRWATSFLTKGITEGRVLDFGCGTGHGTAALRAAGFDAVGYDPDPVAVDWGRNNWDLKDAITTEYPKGFFDAVIAFEVLEHMTSAIGRQIADLLIRAPIVIGSFPFDEPAGANPHHVHSGITPERIRSSSYDGASLTFFAQAWDGTITVGEPTDRSATPIILFIAQRTPRSLATR